MIDPEVLKLDELPDPTAGKRAHEIFEARRKEIETIRGTLKTLREAAASVAAGFEVILNEALGSPHPDLDLLNFNMTNPDPAVVAAAKETIQNELHITVEAFTR